MTAAELSSHLRRLAAVRIGAGRHAVGLLEALAGRPSRSRLGTIGVGLGIAAALLSGQMFALPLLALMAWFCLPHERTAYLLAALYGVVGVAWVAVGVGLIVLGPLVVAGLAWIWMALMLALVRIGLDNLRHLRLR